MSRLASLFAALPCNIDLKVSLAVDYTPPPDFDYNPVLGLFRAASGPFRLFCNVAGNTGAVTYYIQGRLYTTSNHYYYRSILHSRDTGNYICTATDAWGLTGEASTTVKVIGKSCLICATEFMTNHLHNYASY